MEKNSKKVSTGAKKATKFVSLLALTTALALTTPITAAAYVDSTDIIGEEQTYEDRTDIKIDEAEDVKEYFTGYDRHGDRKVTFEQILKACELSDVLNAYNDYDTYYYSNTRKSEVLNLDIDDMYNEYLADYKYGYSNFCRRNIDNKPAIDAYLNFSCGTISSTIKEDIERSVFNALSAEGVQLSHYPKVRMYKDKVYAIARVNGFVQLIELDLDEVNELATTCENLEGRFNLCLRNIGGYTNNYPNSFAYNGIDAITGESAWLSLGDDGLKENLRTGIEQSYNFDNNLTTNISSDQFFVWENKDIEAMRFFGFTNKEINNAIKREASISYTYGLVK